MKQPDYYNAPIEFCRTPALYPFYLHVFNSSILSQPEVVPRHWHRNIEITYRLRYKGTLYVSGKKYPLTDDSLHIINSCEIHEIHTDLNSERYAVLVSISYDFLKKVIPDIGNFHLQADAHSEQMKKIILKMKQEYDCIQPYSYLRLNSLIYELVYYMMTDAVPLKYSSAHSRNSTQVHHKKEIIDYLENHITEISSVRQLSSELGYSREYFSRMVRDCFGVTCQQLLMEARLSLAVRLMENTTDSLAKIAEKAGFSSFRTFSRNFRNYYGEKPESFLKNTL